MAVKNIYVNKGDLINIHIVDDTTVKPNKGEWVHQLHPRRLQLTVRDFQTIGFYDTSYQFRQEQVDGRIIRYLK